MENTEISDYNEPLKYQLNDLEQNKNVPSPNNPPWNGWMATFTWFASVLFIAIIPSLGVLIYLISKGINLKDSAQVTEFIQTDTNALLINVLGVFPAHILTLLLAWLVVTMGKKYSFTEMLGWKWGGVNLIQIIGIVVGFFIVAIVLGNIFPEQDNEFMRLLRSSRTVVLVVAFMATFSAPIVEEVIYRGVLYSAFQRSFGVIAAVSLVTLLFAAVHVPQYYPSVVSISVICLLSLVITLVRVKSVNLLPCIILHTIFNGIQSLVMVAEPFLKQTSENQTQPSFFFFLQ